MTFLDGDRVTPGTERCVCGPDCEFPCFQRIGLTVDPCCPGCAPLPAPESEDNSDVPGAMQVETSREIPGEGVIEFEFSPTGWLTKAGSPRLRDWRAYFWTPEGRDKRERVISATTLLDAICPKNLSYYGEKHGVLGAMEAIRRGELDPSTHTDEDAVERVKALRLGVDAATSRAADRGLDVHSALEENLRSDDFPDLDEVPPEHRGYYEALYDWLKQTKPKPVAIEQLVASPDDGYAGRLDLIADIGSGRFVLDLKTQERLQVRESHLLQVGLYERAARWCGDEVDGAYVLTVSADGKHKLTKGASQDAIEQALRWYRTFSPYVAQCESVNRAEKKLRRAA